MNDDRGRTDADARARADAILRDALDLPAADRPAFVRAAAGGDAALAAEVLALLEDAAGDPTGLAPGSALAGAFGGALLRRFEPARADARVGAFRVVREIGRGGMSVVYLAERAEGGFTQQVALKIAVPGALSDALVRRFERERQMVASLDHPNIARLLDGGRTDDGRPYFAMELVDGERIDAHCDRLRLEVDARIALVCTVAAAVQHAHARLLVHRDIKPGNILISRAGEVKLLDFGIAKPIGLHPEAGEEPLTRTDVRPMTPEYASPEMVRGGPVTTASDVYQIGLLLYELLTGARAQPLDGATATQAERVVCDIDPPPPSVAALRPRPGGALSAGDTARAVEARAAARSSTPAALARRLQGDLDAIVMQAVRKEPDRRYATPLDLANDLKAALASEPVRARRGTTLYRARKFVRRNRVATAFAATVLTLLVGFGLSMAILYERASANLIRARAAEGTAAHEAETARQVSDFLVRLFGVSDPGEARGSTVTARALLDDAAKRIGPELESQPEVQARLMQVMGQVYINLGLYDAAEPLLRDALTLAGKTSGADSAASAEALDALGTLAVVRGAPEEGESLHRRALAIRERLGPADGADVAKTLTSLGQALIEQARYDEAEPVLKRALGIRERIFSPEATEVSLTLNELAEVYNRQARYADAEPLYLRSLAITEKTLGPNHPDLGYKFNNLGLLYKRMGRFDEAEALYKRALQVREAVLPPDHPLIAWTLDNLGMLYITRKRYDEAGPLLARALSIAERAAGPEHPDTAIVINNLALLRAAQGRNAEAETLHRRSIAIWEKTGPDSPQIAGGLHNLARLCASTGRTAEATRLYRRALAIREAKLGADHPLTRTTRDALSALTRP
ncbi:MAG TPA: serine/threonine-protein kinase [Candidatus Polarisedimenticolia bacterium]|nr:serine/threonine-protein kinase [Candidatus Polarisedimenticolia bacterium]